VKTISAYSKSAGWIIRTSQKYSSHDTIPLKGKFQYACFSGLYSFIFIKGDFYFMFVGQEAGQDHRRAEGQDLQR
jgi:hypothetical protein